MSKTLTVTLLLALALLAGCDTSARISFQDARLNAARTTGFTLPKDSCYTPGGNLVSRFLLFDTEGGVVTKGGTLQGTEVTEANLSLSFDGGGASNFLDAPCGPSTCASPYSCSAEECTLQNLSLTASGATFLSDTSKDKVIGILSPVSAAESGSFPNNYKLGIFYNPDGSRVIRDNSADADKVTSIDKDGGLQQLIGNLGLTVESIGRKVGEENGKKVYVGIYSYSDTSGVKIYPQKSRSLPSASSAAAAAEDLSKEYQSAQNLEGVANVFGAIETVLSKPADKAAPTLATKEGERILIVIVAGPDGARTPPDKAIQAAKDANVRLFFVHFDPPLPANRQNDVESLYPDFPIYYQNQSAACTSDSDCYAYEKCDFPMLYRASGGGGSEVGGVSFGKRCLINRNAKGEVGPIDTYSQAACETGGGYIYLPAYPSKTDLYELANWVPWSVVGLWEIPLNSGSTSFPSRSRNLVTGKATLSVGTSNGETTTATFAPPEASADILTSVRPAFVPSPKLSQTP